MKRNEHGVLGTALGAALLQVLCWRAPAVSWPTVVSGMRDRETFWDMIL